jgi:hypothetical protein
MLPLAVWQPAPPHAFVLFNFWVLEFDSGVVAEAEPEEGTLPMLFVLVIFAYVHITICIYLTSLSAFLIVYITSLVESPVFVYCDSLI